MPTLDDCDTGGEETMQRDHLMRNMAIKNPFLHPSCPSSQTLSLLMPSAGKMLPEVHYSQMTFIKQHKAHHLFKNPLKNCLGSS
jgi:hypothetical protein